jgi:hypothetical protein
MDVSLLTLGAQASDLALTLNRVALGLFFMISCYHTAVAARLPTQLTRSA